MHEEFMKFLFTEFTLERFDHRFLPGGLALNRAVRLFGRFRFIFFLDLLQPPTLTSISSVDEGLRLSQLTTIAADFIQRNDSVV